MLIDEAVSYPTGSHADETPEYWVEFWDVSEGFILEAVRVRDAVDVHQVEAWAQSRHPDRFTIYCVAGLPQVKPTFLRVSGYEPYTGDDNVEAFISNAERAERVRNIIYEADGREKN